MKKIFTLLSFLIIGNLSAQNKYAVELIDKDNDRVEYFIQHPDDMLTQRSIQRRQTLNISLDHKDVPIDGLLIKQCSEIGVEILSSSKWLNTLFISATNEQIDQIEVLTFVKSVISLEENYTSKNVKTSPILLSKKMASVYGESEVFVAQIKIDYLHNKGYTGEGIQIAVLDAGFPGVNTKDAFKELRERNGIVGTYNFVEKSVDVYKNHYHGTMVLSTMGVNKPNIYLGTAYEAKYWLFTTEDVNSETPIEEFNWIKAAEYADSVGVDVINSSLGYYDYDSPYRSYIYNDMDGKTSYVSRGATIGAEKGILIALSAGNEGDKDWKYIITPSDAKNVITVGAVNNIGTPANFTSYGPSADGRIKPDIAAMGVAVPVYDENGNLRNVNGTSFSSPITAGSVACLRQAFPKASVTTIINALHNSASISTSPDDRIGYGIANFEKAFIIINDQLSINDITLNKLRISPNPISNIIKIKGIDDEINSYSVIDNSGRIILNGKGNFYIGVDFTKLNTGYYQLIIDYNIQKINFSFIKQ